MNDTPFDKELDVSQKMCPYPSLQTIEVLNKMKVGQILRVIVKSIRSVENIRNQLGKAKGRWLSYKETDDGYGWIIYLERVDIPEGLGDWVEAAFGEDGYAIEKK